MAISLKIDCDKVCWFLNYSNIKIKNKELRLDCCLFNSKGAKLKFNIIIRESQLFDAKFVNSVKFWIFLTDAYDDIEIKGKCYKTKSRNISKF